MKLGVRALATLTLEDSLGVLEFNLTAEEFASVEVPTWGADFQSIVDHPELCRGTPDMDSSLQFQRAGQDPVEIQNFSGCTPDGPVIDINVALRALLSSHFTCPATGLPGVIPLPQRTLCAGCDDCARTDCQGVIVTRGAESYCVGPDSSRFACPESRPVRARLNGAAICAAEPGVPTEFTAREVAREALQTALIQSQASIMRLLVPAESTHWPGLAGGTRVEGTAVISDSGTAWFSGDEGPIFCGEAFDHLEIEPAGDGLGFVVSAWNDVVDCGQPQGAIAQEVPAPATFELPDAPGLYPVVLGQPYGSTAGPTLLVEKDDACPAEPPPLDACYTGRPVRRVRRRAAAGDLLHAGRHLLCVVHGRLPGGGPYAADRVRPDGHNLPGVRHGLGPRALEPGAGHGPGVRHRPRVRGARCAGGDLHL